MNEDIGRVSPSALLRKCAVTMEKTRNKVALRLKPENEWKAPSSRFLDQELQPGAEEAEGKESNEKKQPTGEIVAIIKRAWRPYCGVIEAPSGSSSSSRVLFSPAQRQIPKIRIETQQVERLIGKRLVVACDGWGRKSRNGVVIIYSVTCGETLKKVSPYVTE